MTIQPVPSKYGAALTGSDWVGLPLRIGQIPESGVMEDLKSEHDAVLAWSGGPSDLTIDYVPPAGGPSERIEFRRNPGAIDLLPRHTHLLRVAWHGKPSVCVSINLPVATTQELSGETLALSSAAGPKFGITDAHVFDLIKRLEAQAAGKEFLGAVYVQSLSLTLASYLAARYGAEPAQAQRPDGARLTEPQAAKIRQFIEDELETNFSLIELARLSGYGPDHFARLFKESFQQSPHQYVLTRRIERAKAMLRDTTQSIADIALSCGFGSQAHFTTAFKQQTGTTPGAFRRA